MWKLFSCELNFMIPFHSSGDDMKLHGTGTKWFRKKETADEKLTFFSFSYTNKKIVSIPWVKVRVHIRWWTFTIDFISSLWLSSWYFMQQSTICDSNIFLCITTELYIMWYDSGPNTKNASKDDVCHLTSKL